MPRRPLYPDDRTVAFTVRLPERLKRRLEERARRNLRSLNQEIVWLLQWALEHLSDTGPGPTPEDAPPSR